MAGIKANNERYKMIKLYCDLSNMFSKFIAMQNKLSMQNSNISMIKFVYDYELNEIVLYNGTETIHYDNTGLRDVMIIDLFENTTNRKSRLRLKEENSRMYKKYQASLDRTKHKVKEWRNK